MSEKLKALPEQIKKARLRAERFPEDEDLADELQQKIDDYNKLKDEFAEHQQFLFNAAKRAAKYRGEVINKQIRDAIEALEAGDVHKANIILDLAEEDAHRDLEDFKQSREITEQKRQNLISQIQRIMLSADATMADTLIPIDERVVKTENKYDEADRIAQEIGYDKNKYIELLDTFGEFLFYRGKYQKCVDILERLYNLRVEVLGENNIDISVSLHNLGTIYRLVGNYTESLRLCKKSVSLGEKILGENNIKMALLYDTLGTAYRSSGHLKEGLTFSLKALNLREQIY